MDIQQKIETLKSALLFEHRAQVFYNSVAGMTKNAGVAAVFSHMADEEASHVEYIREHLRALHSGGSFADIGSYPRVMEVVFDAQSRVSIIGASCEAAAVSAAVALEEKSIAFYREQAELTTEPEEMEFYQWLAGLELHHLEELRTWVEHFH